MLYLDTSVLVSALTRELHTARAQAWLQRNRAEEIAISDWLDVEFAAALAGKEQRGELDPEARHAARAAHRAAKERSYRFLLTASATFRRAAELAEQNVNGLRSADALHLAIAAAHDARLCTPDHRQAQAGEALGLKTELI